MSGGTRRWVRLGGLTVIFVLGAAMLAAPRPSSGKGGYGYNGYGYEQPPTPTATTTATATPTTSPSPEPTVQPKPFRYRLRVLRRQTARSVRRRGLRLRLTCSHACRSTTRVSINRRTARRLRIARRATVIGRRTVRLRAGRPRTVKVVLNRRARRGIRRMRRARMRRLPLTIRSQAVDAAQRRVRVTLRVRLRR